MSSFDVDVDKCINANGLEGCEKRLREEESRLIELEKYYNNVQRRINSTEVSLSSMIAEGRDRSLRLEQTKTPNELSMQSTSEKLDSDVENLRHFDTVISSEAVQQKRGALSASLETLNSRILSSYSPPPDGINEDERNYDQIAAEIGAIERKVEILNKLLHDKFGEVHIKKGV